MSIPPLSPNRQEFIELAGCITDTLLTFFIHKPATLEEAASQIRSMTAELFTKITQDSKYEPDRLDLLMLMLESIKQNKEDSLYNLSEMFRHNFEIHGHGKASRCFNLYTQLQKLTEKRRDSIDSTSTTSSIKTTSSCSSEADSVAEITSIERADRLNALDNPLNELFTEIAISTTRDSSTQTDGDRESPLLPFPQKRGEATIKLTFSYDSKVALDTLLEGICAF